MCRADLHVHSKYSDRPSEWILRRLGSPESFVEPVDLYNRARELGMDYVTISDHNCINGALAISHLPGTFISTEVTTYFPEDGCKMHVLATGITEAQFAEIDRLRTNIYDFRNYAIEQNIILSVAHPMFRVNHKLSPEHIEKLMVLFNRFEGINGARDPRACDMASAVLRALTPEMLDRLADKHDIAPTGNTPWRKVFTGGSDDHSGLYIAGARTVTPPADSVDAFLDHIRAGRHDAEGEGGDSLRMAHNFYAIAYSYYRRNVLERGSGQPSILGELFKKLLEPTEAAPQTLASRVKGLAGRVVRKHKLRSMDPVERMLVDEFSQLFQGKQQTGSLPAVPDAQRCFDLACNVSHTLGYTFLTRSIERARQGSLIESLQAVAALAPVGLSVMPYLAAFTTQQKDEKFLQQVADYFPAAAHMKKKSECKAWLTDTFGDVNGVSQTIRTLSQLATRRELPLTVMTSLEESPMVDADLRNFAPVGMFSLPEYPQQRLAFPPVLEVIESLDSGDYSEVIISTPGPMGLAGLAAGKLLGLELTGIYHTDFPAYVEHLTEDPNMATLAQRFMIWFYEQMDRIIAPSEYYRMQLVDMGLDASKIEVISRGVDTDRFKPQRRKENHFKQYGLKDGGLTYLYVGRVSAEKNIHLLLAAFERLATRRDDVRLVVVGDGPSREDLAKRYPQQRVAFTGTLTGVELADVYASADVFVFPSTTDTFGNVVLEAQASGLPCIVSDKGGPREIASRNDSALVVEVDQAGQLLEAMDQLYEDEGLRITLGTRGLANARSRSWDEVLNQLWYGTKQAEEIENAKAIREESDADEADLLQLA